jgi:hypothetical protein
MTFWSATTLPLVAARDPKVPHIAKPQNLRPSPYRDLLLPTPPQSSKEQCQQRIPHQTVRTCLQGFEPDQESVRPVGGG